MADTAADVPGKYDVVIDGHGYIFANALAPSIPFRTQRAKYGYSPTFVARQNVSGNFGDNQQDFWLTLSQNDWSAGEDQRYLHVGDPDTLHSFYAGSAIEISVPGQVSMVCVSDAKTAAAAVVGMVGHPYQNYIYFATATNLYILDASSVLTNAGAHGVTAGPGIVMCPGQPNVGATDVYIGSPVTGIRKYNGGAFSAFNATTAPDALVFANNTVYGASAGTFWSYDTAGVATTQANFKSGSGVIVSDTAAHKLLYFGGAILYIRQFGLSGGELWQYTGTPGISLLASLPPNFELLDACVAMGVVILSGRFNSDRGLRPGIFYYYNGTINLLWQAESWQSAPSFGAAMVAPFRTGFVFTDEPRLQVRYYDLNTGAISAIYSYAAPGFTLTTDIATANTHIAVHSQSTAIDHWPQAGTTATSSYVTTSLVDFDSSLLKNFRGVIVEWDPASDGNGGTVDIAYRLNSISPSATYTSFQTGITSGTEYFFSGVQGRSISIKVTLKKGTSTSGPVLRRIYLRAAPTQQTFRNDEMILDCTGANGKTPVSLRNGNDHTLDGKDMVTNIRAAITSSSPITITDRFGTVSAIIDAANVEIIEIQPEEYWVRLPFREV